MYFADALEHPELLGLKKRLPIKVIRKCYADMRDTNLERYLDNKAVYGAIKDMFRAEIIERGKLIGKAIGLQIALNYLNSRVPHELNPILQIETRLKEIEEGGTKTE